MNSTKIITSAFTFASLFILPCQGALTLFYSTNFNTPTYSAGALIGQDNWTITGTSVVSPLTVANAIAGNGNVSVATTGQDVFRAFPSVNSGSVYFSASINVQTAQTGDYLLHLGDTATPNGFFSRLYVKAGTTGYVLGMTTGSPSAITGPSAVPAVNVNYGTVELSLNQAYSVLLRFDFVPGLANDTGSLFVNPTSTDGSLDTSYIAATYAGTDATAISTVNIRQGGSTSSPTAIVDNLSISSSVPEVSTLAMAVLSCMGLLRRRR